MPSQPAQSAPSQSQPSYVGKPFLFNDKDTAHASFLAERMSPGALNMYGFHLRNMTTCAKTHDEQTIRDAVNLAQSFMDEQVKVIAEMESQRGSASTAANTTPSTGPKTKDGDSTAKQPSNSAVSRRV